MAPSAIDESTYDHTHDSQSHRQGSETPAWPRKTRDVYDNHTDSSRWNQFVFRPDDIVICTWAKCGTTWTQQIISQLIHGGEEGHRIHHESPWIDMRIVPAAETLAALEAQQHRRYIKTHTPLDALRYDHQAKYVLITRDPRDMVWSLHNHYHFATDLLYDLLNNESPGKAGPPRERPPPDPRQYFLDILEDDSRNSLHQPFWSYMRDWWAARNLPNCLFVHYNDLKRDMEGEIRRIADFLEIDVKDEAWPAILEHCEFKYMKAHSQQFSPDMAEVGFKGGSDTFINKGYNGRWKDSLTDEDNQRYLAKLRAELGDECADWVTNGRNKA